MKLTVLTVEEDMSYDGTYTYVVGIYSSREKAEEHMLINYEAIRAELQQSDAESVGNDYYARELQKHITPTAENKYVFYDQYKCCSYCFEEIELDAEALRGY